MKLTNIPQRFFWIGSCLFLISCSDTQRYYIPIVKLEGNAKPLSQQDRIRVVLPYDYVNYRTKMNTQSVSENKKQYRHNINIVTSLNNEKLSTENALQQLGFNIISSGLNPITDGKPTVVALLNPQPQFGSISVKNDSKNHVVFTEHLNNTQTFSYYYKIQLIRPIGSDNPLLNCNNSDASFGLCVAPQEPKKYQIIFTGYIPVISNPSGPLFSTKKIDVHNVYGLAIFYHYPDVIGKKWVYFIYKDNDEDANLLAKPIDIVDPPKH